MSQNKLKFVKMSQNPGRDRGLGIKERHLAAKHWSLKYMTSFRNFHYYSSFQKLKLEPKSLWKWKVANLLTIHAFFYFQTLRDSLKKQKMSFSLWGQNLLSPVLFWANALFRHQLQVSCCNGYHVVPWYLTAWNETLRSLGNTYSRNKKVLTDDCRKSELDCICIHNLENWMNTYCDSVI